MDRYFEEEPKAKRGGRRRVRLPWQKSKKAISIYQEFLQDYDKAMFDEDEQGRVIKKYARRLMHRGYTKLAAERKLAQILAKARQEGVSLW